MERGVDSPVILQVLRPYASEAEFVAAEAWTLESKGALLIGQAPLEVGTIVRFDVVLTSGERIVRAEGRVVKHVEATHERPGGLRVRYTRFGGSTKNLIDRIVAMRRQSLMPRSSEAAPSPSLVPALASRLPLPLAPTRVEHASFQRALRERTVKRVVPPENREALLERLRARALKLRASE